MEWGGHEAFFFTRLLTIEEKRKKKAHFAWKWLFFSWKKVNMYVRFKITFALTYVRTFVVENLKFLPKNGLGNKNFASLTKFIMISRLDLELAIPSIFYSKVVFF